MSKQNTGEVQDSKVLMAIANFFAYLVEAFIYGLKAINWKDSLVRTIGVCSVVIGFLLSLSNIFVLLGNPIYTFVFFVGSITVLLVTPIGIPVINLLQKFQKDLDEVGVKSAKGKSPKVLKVIKIDEFRTKLLIGAKGIGVDRFENKRSDLTSSFGQIIESISLTDNLKFVEIFLTTRKFPTISPFDDLIGKVEKPYHILIGESRRGVEYESLLDAPHFLISGTTGGGKSMFFNNCLLSLAKSTLAKKERPAIQFYLVDLKKGVEVQSYEDWPNVKIAKDEASALKVMKALIKEMGDRYDLLRDENKGNKVITPEIHNKDILVLAIDEASVLFGKTSNKKKAKLVNECKDAFDDLCKLARASGIHIIAATQKPIKDAIDTRSLENLAGRVCFKMASSKGSELALGNGRASKLPDVKGRCIWRRGNKFEEIQAPYLSDEQVMEECMLLAEEFKKDKNGNYQEMLDFEKVTEETGNSFRKGLKKEEGTIAED